MQEKKRDFSFSFFFLTELNGVSVTTNKYSDTNIHTQSRQVLVGSVELWEKYFFMPNGDKKKIYEVH